MIRTYTSQINSLEHCHYATEAHLILLHNRPQLKNPETMV